jgi:ABC-type Mn2+/Zn2+ transport system permease subunit
VSQLSLLDAFGDGFARRALLEAVMVGGLCGAVGVHVLLRRLPFFTMALGHATFPGVVLAALLGVSLFLGAALFGAVVVVVVALLGARERVDDTSAVGVTLSGAFALGVLLLSAQAGFSRDLSAYLVGSIVTVQPSDLVTTAVVGAVVLGVLAALHKELVLGAFDRVGLAALGYPVLALDIALLLLVEATVVTSIPAVGTILAVALIVAPAATARLWTERLRATMTLSAALGAASGLVGLAISLQWRVAAGATIVLVAAALFAISLVVAPHHGLLARRRAAAALGGAGAPGGSYLPDESESRDHSGRLAPAAIAWALCQWRVAKIRSLMASIGPTALMRTRIPRRW